MTLEERQAAHIKIAIDALLRYGAKYPDMEKWDAMPGYSKPLVSTAEAVVLVDYYLERADPAKGTGVESFNHDQAPGLYRRRIRGFERSPAGTTAVMDSWDTYALARPAAHTNEYRWEFTQFIRGRKTEGTTAWRIPNQTTHDMFASLWAAEDRAPDQSRIDIFRQVGKFDLNHSFSPESLQAWEKFLVWLAERDLSKLQASLQ
jgi:hypothetical protein